MNVFWKKFIVWGTLVALAVPLVFFTAKNFREAHSNFNEEELLSKLNLPEVKQKMAVLELDKIKEAGEELGKLIEEMTTSTTSTNNF